MSRTKFISASEVVLVKRSYAQGPYFGETDCFPKTYATVREAWLAHDDDDVLSAYRVDVDTMKVEDITEDFAACYLRERSPHPSEKDKLPPYVRNSPLWDDYEDEWYRNQRWFADARKQGVA